MYVPATRETYTEFQAPGSGLAQLRLRVYLQSDSQVILFYMCVSLYTEDTYTDISLRVFQAK